MRFIKLVWLVIKYASIGMLIWLVGTLFFGSSMNFAKRSVPAQLMVVEMQSHRGTRGYTEFRPIFVLEAASSPRKEYAGNVWMRPAPHQAGDVVSGRYDPENGEMHSDKMLSKSIWLGRMARIFGVLVGLQALAIILGIPEDRLPLRIRRRRRRSLFQIRV